MKELHRFKSFQPVINPCINNIIKTSIHKDIGIATYLKVGDETISDN